MRKSVIFGFAFLLLASSFYVISLMAGVTASGGTACYPGTVACYNVSNASAMPQCYGRCPLGTKIYYDPSCASGQILCTPQTSGGRIGTVYSTPATYGSPYCYNGSYPPCPLNSTDTGIHRGDGVYNISLDDYVILNNGWKMQISGIGNDEMIFDLYNPPGNIQSGSFPYNKVPAGQNPDYGQYVTMNSSGTFRTLGTPVAILYPGGGAGGAELGNSTTLAVSVKLLDVNLKSVWALINVTSINQPALCSQFGGNLCSSGQTCSSRVLFNTSDSVSGNTCCLGGMCQSATATYHSSGASNYQGDGVYNVTPGDNITLSNGWRVYILATASSTNPKAYEIGFLHYNPKGVLQKGNLFVENLTSNNYEDNFWSYPNGSVMTFGNPEEYSSNGFSVGNATTLTIHVSILNTSFEDGSSYETIKVTSINEPNTGLSSEGQNSSENSVNNCNLAGYGCVAPQACSSTGGQFISLSCPGATVCCSSVNTQRSSQQGNITQMSPSSSSSCSGCEYNGKCIPFGYRVGNNYCDITGNFTAQLTSGVCDNNFQCSSNLCVNSECVTPSFIQQIINFFKKLLGI